MTVKSHRWEHWLEPNPAEMLNITNERRSKIAIAINNYFKFNTLNQTVVEPYEKIEDDTDIGYIAMIKQDRLVIFDYNAMFNFI